jgi:hypothetical protein
VGTGTTTGHGVAVALHTNADPALCHRSSGTEELIDTVDLPLFPWQAGDKGRFIRIVPTTTSGRRFTIADPRTWQTPLSGVRRASTE